MRAQLLGAVLIVASLTRVSSTGQEHAYKNSIGMEFLLIQPGTFTLGRFQPPYAKPPDPNAPPAPPAGVGQTLGTGIFGQADANGDQHLSRGELVMLANTWFDQMDADKAGRLAQTEFATRFAAIQNQLAGGGTRGGGGAAGGVRGGGRGGVAPALFTAADTNRDGVVARDEFSGSFAEWFDTWDTTKGGALSSNQLVVGLNAALPLPATGRGGPPLTAEQYQLIQEAASKDYREGFPVTISRPFYIAKYEVTQAQYRRVMGANPSMFQGGKVADSADLHPVDSVTWSGAQGFVPKLNELEKTKAYRLPTEFEWEYAARAGATDDIPWNDIRQQAYNVRTTTQAVGKMQPNAWGLYDTLGNVWEWVQDYYNEKIFADPVPPRSGKEHVLKGGGFLADVKNLTYMWHGAGPGNKFDVGFRIVKDLP